MSRQRKQTAPHRRPATATRRDHVPQRPRTPLERLSAPVLLRLHGMPRWLFPAFTGLLLVGGLMVPNAIVAALLLGLLACFLLWLIALSWPLLGLVARFMRLLVVGGLVLVIIGRAQGRL